MMIVKIIIHKQFLWIWVLQFLMQFKYYRCDENVSDDEEEPLKVGDRVLALNKELFSGFSTECIVDQKVTEFERES